MQALVDSIKIDHHQVLSCIKYEVLAKRPVFDSYKTFCERIGDDVMNYPDFMFWYMRFYNGDVDMDYDTKKDPKPLELMQLPVEVVAKYVEKLDLPSRLIFRNVCKPLQLIVDGCKLDFKKLRIYSVYNAHLSIDHEKIDYELHRDELGAQVAEIKYGEREYKTKRANVADFAVSDLKSVIKGHKMELNYLQIDDNAYDAYLFKKVLNVFRDASLNSRFKVKSCCFRCEMSDQIVPVLTLLEPGVLENITVNYISDEIVNTEQWQRARSVSVDTWIALSDATRIERFRHFEAFFIKVTDISAEIMIQLREALLTFPSFKKCTIDRYLDPPFTIDMVSTALGLPIQDKEIHVPIPDSTDVLAIEDFGVYFNIERRSL